MIVMNNFYKRAIVWACLQLHKRRMITKAQFLWSIDEWWKAKNGTTVNIIPLMGWFGGP
jgi:hypothetical protein